MKETKVVNIKYSDYTVYIGRSSSYFNGKWGNPYRIGKDGNRSEVLQKYSNYLDKHPEIVEKALKELEGEILGCHCKPKACHGDILINKMKELYEKLNNENLLNF